jgi:hypothetical protein
MAERRLQPRFSKWLIVGAFLMVAGDSRPELPDREPMPERVAIVQFEPLSLGRNIAPGVTLTGAWRLHSAEPRFAGLSGLALSGTGALFAVTDSGVLVDLPKPGARAFARFRDLLGGPGYATFKKYRDAEALRIPIDPKAPDMMGFEVSFEHRHSLYGYSSDGWRVWSERLPDAGWKANRGAEAMVFDPSGPWRLLLGEEGRNLLVQTHGRTTIRPLTGATGGITEATRLPDGRMVATVREIGLLGLTNRLAWLERSGAGYRLRNFATLSLGPLDNVEGLAAEPRPDGGTILWAVTDNDGWRRTLLLKLEFEAVAPATAPASVG